MEHIVFAEEMNDKIFALAFLLVFKGVITPEEYFTVHQWSIDHPNPTESQLISLENLIKGLTKPPEQ